MPRGRKPTVTDDEILYYMALSAAPIVTTRDLSDYYDMSVQGMRYRLVDLEEEGFIDSRKASSGRVWYLTDQGEERVESAYLD